MRRKDREITDFDEMMKIIAKCDTCRVAMFDETFPYIVPLNFGTDVEDNQLYLYFHGAKIGKKIDLLVDDDYSIKIEFIEKKLIHKEKKQKFIVKSSRRNTYK